MEALPELSLLLSVPPSRWVNHWQGKQSGVCSVQVTAGTRLGPSGTQHYWKVLFSNKSSPAVASRALGAMWSCFLGTGPFYESCPVPRAGQSHRPPMACPQHSLCSLLPMGLVSLPTQHGRAACGGSLLKHPVLCHLWHHPRVWPLGTLQTCPVRIPEPPDVFLHPCPCYFFTVCV